VILTLIVILLDKNSQFLGKGCLTRWNIPEIRRTLAYATGHSSFVQLDVLAPHFIEYAEWAEIACVFSLC
jgi:hypothetical protein